jgi:O-antigen polysaccharide polymerase Wzy
MARLTLEHQGNNPLTWPFLAGFGACCVLFWWLQSLLLHFWLGADLSLEPKTLWISAGALATFALGYILPAPRLPLLSTSNSTLDRCEDFSYRATLILAFPAFLVAIRYLVYRLSVESYFEGQGIALPEQAVMYVHLFVGLLYISTIADPKKDKRKLALAIFLIVAPRLLVAFRWRRFYAAQAIVPIILIALARGWFALSFKRFVQIAVLGLFILFVPALTRGDNVFGEDEYGNPQIVNYFGYMNALGFFQDDKDLAYQCPPLLVSLTAKIVPYGLLNLCTIDVGSDKGLPASTDRMLTKRYSDDMMAGTGSNYLLELYFTGGLTAVFFGSAVFGFSCRRFVAMIGHRSLYASIWAECLSRALLAPRGNLGYVYERIPTLLLATLLVVILSWSISQLRKPGIVRASA